jgi:hypothetical protein
MNLVPYIVLKKERKISFDEANKLLKTFSDRNAISHPNRTKSGDTLIILNTSERHDCIDDEKLDKLATVIKHLG